MTSQITLEELNSRSLTSSVVGTRQTKDLFFLVGLWLAVLIAFGTLATLLIDTFVTGRSRLNKDFLTGFPSPFPEDTGIQAAFCVEGDCWQ